MKAQQKEARSKDASLRRAILVRHCLEMERMGPRPGRALLRVHASMYDPQVREYHRVPGRFVRLLIDSAETLEEAFVVMEEGLRLWARGRWSGGRFQCECGKVLK